MATLDSITTIQPSPNSAIQTVQYSIDLEDFYLPHIREMISKDLSEPYSIYVYRYFLNSWPQYCYLLLDPLFPHPIGVIISKLSPHPSGTLRGYIAMLAISSSHRRRGLGSLLVSRAVASLGEGGAHEVVLETEEDNAASLKLYRRLGFLRTKHLYRYYLNGKGAFRLVRVLRKRDEGEGEGEVEEGDVSGLGSRLETWNGIGEDQVRRGMGIAAVKQIDDDDENRDAELYG